MSKTGIWYLCPDTRRLGVLIKCLDGHTQTWWRHVGNTWALSYGHNGPWLTCCKCSVPVDVRHAAAAWLDRN